MSRVGLCRELLLWRQPTGGKVANELLLNQLFRQLHHLIELRLPVHLTEQLLLLPSQPIRRQKRRVVRRRA